MVNLRFWRSKPIEASHAKGYKQTLKTEAEGKTQTSYQWTERLSHPPNMNRYEEWGLDAEASVALQVLTNIIAGVGYYTEMDEEYRSKPDEKPHKNKTVVDDYGKRVNLDEKLQYITHTMLHKGFSPVEVIEDYDLKLLPPESFYIYMDKKGQLLKYTQERSLGDVITSWEGDEMNTILLFFYGWSPSRPYGKSLLEPIGDLIDERNQMNQDMPKAVHRWAYPIPILETSGPKADLQKACEERDIDEWIFVGNAKEGEVRWNTLAIDPQARFIPYIELVYYQICEGLHAPLLLYLKNATEASATVMMESVDRLVYGVQRYVKRRVERYLFSPQVREPLPRLVWGQPKSGLEDVTFQDLSAIMPYLAQNQQQYLLKQYVTGLPEPEWPKTPPSPMITRFKKEPEGVPVNLEALVERLNDLQTSLNVIEQNHHMGKIGITDACKLADRTITVHMKRAYPNSWQRHRDEEFQKFVRDRLVVSDDGKRLYKVEVG